jgi:hypothetical protein
MSNCRCALPGARRPPPTWTARYYPNPDQPAEVIERVGLLEKRKDKATVSRAGSGAGSTWR